VTTDPDDVTEELEPTTPGPSPYTDDNAGRPQDEWS